MTTERYIRIIAGTFVLVSLALGTWVNPQLVLVYSVCRRKPPTIRPHAFWCLMEDILRKFGVGAESPS